MRKKLCLVLLDISLVTIIYFLAFVLRFELEGALLRTSFIYISLPILIVVTIGIFVRMGMYNSVWRYASLDSLVMVIKAVTYSVLVTVVILFFLDEKYTPRGVFVIYWMLFLMGTGGVRFSTRFYRYYSARRVKRGMRVLIYGAGYSGQMIAKEMVLNKTLGYNPVCFVDDDSVKVGKKIHSLSIYSGAIDLDTIIRENDIEVVLIAISSTSGEKIRKIVESCKLPQIKFKTIPSLLGIVNGEIGVTQIRNIAIGDLLKRAPKDLDQKLVESFVAGKSVLITGAGGSIGSELSRQVVQCSPSVVMLVDNNEYGLYKIDSELSVNYNNLDLHSLLENIINPLNTEDHLRRIKTDIIFHSAAYKHVSLVETNPCEAIINNIQGAVNAAKLADKYKVKKFVLISTDKAVRPTSVMGATKRVCELYIQNFNNRSDTDFVAVRFGNVLDSSGSVVPKFKQQIMNGGPVTVTHPDATRYFMLIPEAVQLVMQAASLGKGGEVFILDMGEPVNIENMAKDMIRMMGFSLEEVKIDYIGLKPGEKLSEELLIDDKVKDTKYESITIADVTKVNWEEFESNMNKLIHCASEHDVDAAIKILKKLVPEYNPQNAVYEAMLNTTKCDF